MSYDLLIDFFDVNIVLLVSTLSEISFVILHHVVFLSVVVVKCTNFLLIASMAVTILSFILIRMI